jgi:hypothetical protein
MVKSVFNGKMIILTLQNYNILGMMSSFSTVFLRNYRIWPSFVLLFGAKKGALGRFLVVGELVFLNIWSIPKDVVTLRFQAK